MAGSLVRQERVDRLELEYFCFSHLSISRRKEGSTHEARVTLMDGRVRQKLDHVCILTVLNSYFPNLRRFNASKGFPVYKGCVLLFLKVGHVVEIAVL